MKRFTTAVLMMVGLMAVWTTGAAAQQQQYATQVYREFALMGGTTFGDNNDGTAAGAVTFNITSRLGLEPEAGVIFGDDTRFNGSMNLTYNLGTGLSAIVPYLISGAGVLTNGGTDMALNVGGGLKMFLDPRIALRLDFRAYFFSESGDVEDLERLVGGFTFFF